MIDQSIMEQIHENYRWHSYKHVISLNGEELIQRMHDGAWIPKTEDNGDYRRYLLWVAAGNIPEVDNYIENEKQRAAERLAAKDTTNG